MMVWVSELLPLGSPPVAAPSRAEYDPPWCCAVLTVGAEAPLVAHPLKFPASNPPLTTGFELGAVTVSDTVVLCVADVPVPVTVTVLVPVGVDAAVAMVSVELPPELTLAGLKEAVAPLGKPLALSATGCAVPDVTAVLIVDVPLEPCVILRLDGFAAIEKSLATVVTATSSRYM